MIRIVVVIVGVFFSITVFGQVHSGLTYETGSKEDIHPFTCFLDTTNNILYAAGYYDTIANVRRHNLSAFDLKTGAILPWNPIVSDGRIYSVIKWGDIIFIGGHFTNVNGHSRNHLAAINASTGALLGWNPNPNGAVSSLGLNGNYLYVGGQFSSIAGSSRTYLAVFDLTMGGSIHPWSPPLTVSDKFFKDIKVVNNKIYGITSPEFFNCVYELTFNTSAKIKTAEGNNHINDYLVYNNHIYCVGPFSTINGVGRNNAACISISGSVQPWQPAVNTTTLQAVYRIENYKDTFFISSFANNGDTARNYIKKYSPNGSGNYIGLFKYYNAINFANNLVISSDKMIEISYVNLLPPLSDHFKNRIDIYCFKPDLPKPFIVSSSSVCQGQREVRYILPLEQGFASCEWSYTGTGATINGTSTNVTIDFSPTATSGILNVKGINICGLKSFERSLPIVVNPIPSANAGSDDTITCMQPQVSLQGASTSSPITYTWHFSGGTLSGSTINVSSGGTYTLTVTNSETGCKNTDIVQVLTNTVSPVLQALPDYDTLNCYSPSIVLSGVTSDPLDSLRWLNASGQGFPNPYTAVAEGSCVCIAIDRENGCASRDTVTIIEDIVSPSASAVLSDTILTCENDSVWLTGSSTNSSVKIIWYTAGGDTFANPLHTSSPGLKTLLVTDTSNGCFSAMGVNIGIDKRYPVLSAIGDSVALTCSYSSALLNAQVYPAYSLLQWHGPAGQLSNPVTATVTGNYIVNAIDTLNGCETRDSVQVVYKPHLSVNAGNDTLICNGSSVILTANVVNGTPGFNFVWNSGLGSMQSVVVSPPDTTQYILYVTDAAGCYGKDTVTVFTAPSLTDSIATFLPCAQQGVGQLQVFVSGGVPPYQYSINGGSSFQSVPVFDSLVLGKYQVIIRDTLGCMHSDSAVLNLNSFQPEVNFLVSTTIYSGDTLVLVDISNPRPDTVLWEFPAGVRVINNNFFAPVIVCSDTGYFSVTMRAVYSDCVLEKQKEVSVYRFDSLLANNYNNNGIESVHLSPNPNNGVFNVDVSMHLKQTFVLLVYDAAGVERYRKVVAEADAYSGNIILDDPISGTYLFMVIAEYDVASKIFMVTQ